MIKAAPDERAILSAMPAFLFTCPVTGAKVQGWTSDARPEFDYYEAIECPACRGVHLVDPRTGKVAGADGGRGSKK